MSKQIPRRNITMMKEISLLTIFGQFVYPWFYQMMSFGSEARLTFSI